MHVRPLLVGGILLSSRDTLIQLGRVDNDTIANGLLEGRGGRAQIGVVGAAGGGLDAVLATANDDPISTINEVARQATKNISTKAGDLPVGGEVESDGIRRGGLVSTLVITLANIGITWVG